MNGKDPVDNALCERQFQEIALNNGEFQGKYLVIESNNTGSLQAILDLTGMLGEAFEKLDLLYGPYSFYRILKIPAGGSRSLVTGYASGHSPTGRQMARLRVLAEREELERLRSMLEFLYTEFKALEGTGRRKDVKAVLKALGQTAAGILPGREVQEDNELRGAITGLPLRTPALRITPRDLAAMDATTFQWWLARLEASMKTVERLLGKAEWVDVSDGKSKGRYLFMDLVDLP